MRKIFLFSTLCAITLLAACSNKATQTKETTAAQESVANESKEETKAETSEKEKKDLVTLKVGATPAPHAEILEFAKPILEKEGIKLDIVVFNDYVLPNNAVNSGEIDANYFQHLPYLEQFNKENKTDVVSVGAIHYEPIGIYKGKLEKIEDLKEGSTIAVPNDVTNEARALLLLADSGFIKLKEDAGLEATKNDIIDNPLNLDIKEIEAAQIPRAIKDVDFAVINGNYAIDAGFKVNDALTVEEADSVAAVTYANIVATKSDKANDENIKKLVEVLNGPEVKEFINNKYEGSVVPSQN